MSFRRKKINKKIQQQKQEGKYTAKKERKEKVFFSHTGKC